MYLVTNNSSVMKVLIFYIFLFTTVLVHCSDGWDRTPQIVSLAQLMLDPYYRTIDGFRTLCEVCWLDFGHKMADRNGTVGGGSDTNERAPIFLQVWLKRGLAMKYLF